MERRHAEPTGHLAGDVGVPAPAAHPPAGQILALQRAAGNAAVARRLARVTTPAAQQSEFDTARKERDHFIKAGRKGPVTYSPSDRNADNYYGGFDVAYDPAPPKPAHIVQGAVKEPARKGIKARPPP